MCLVVGSTAGAVQDARAWPSTGFRPPFGLGLVTLERPKVTKGLLPRQSAGFASALGPEPTSDGPPQVRLIKSNWVFVLLAAHLIKIQCDYYLNIKLMVRVMIFYH